MITGVAIKLKRVCIFACLIVSCFILQAMTGINIPTGIKKATFSNDGLVYILAKRETSIRVHSADGSPRQSLIIDPTNSLKLQGGEPQDFIVDANGDIYCLTFCPELPNHQSGIVRINKMGSESTIISLSKPLDAFQMNRDLAGNFYLLGFERSINKSMAQNEDLPSTVYIVHKFSPNGKYLGSLLPIKGTSVDDMLYNAMRIPSSFVVLPNGEVWFFELRVDFTIPPWQNLWAVHRVDTKGFAARVDPTSPANYFLMGIHEYNGDVAFEWVNMKSSLLRLLTRIDGTRIGAVEGGAIKAISKDRAVCSRLGEGGVFQLIMAPIN
jgi:hypothetical protein